MQSFTLESFNELLAVSPLKPRVKREVRFNASVGHMSDTEWAESELVAVTERSENKGVLIVSVDETTHLLAYEIKRGMASNLTGRAQPIICDLCRTWQSGSRAGSVTFPLPGQQKSISYLCCADLRCSAHVRSKTSASKTSRSQLREDISTEERVERLQKRLTQLVKDINGK